MDTYEFMRILGERSNRVDRLYYKWAKAFGLSYNLLAVLYVAYKDPNSTQKVVCEEWGLPKQTVNTVCKELRDKGYLTLEKSRRDGREARLSLTEKGKNMAKPIVERLLSIESRILESMGKDAVCDLLALFNTFCDEAERMLTASAKERESGERIDDNI